MHPQSIIEDAKGLISNGLYSSAEIILSLLLSALQNSTSVSFSTSVSTSLASGEAMALLADCLVMKKEYRRAISHYEKALHHFRLSRTGLKRPGSLEMDVRRRFGKCCIDVKHWDTGARVLEGIPETERICSVNMMLACIYEETGDYRYLSFSLLLHSTLKLFRTYIFFFKLELLFHVI